MFIYNPHHSIDNFDEDNDNDDNEDHEDNDDNDDWLIDLTYKIKRSTNY